LYWHGAALELLFLRALFLPWQSKRSPRVMRKPAAHIVDTAAARKFLAPSRSTRASVGLDRACQVGLGKRL